jgi:protoporphyrinogen oxidase
MISPNGDKSTSIHSSRPINRLSGTSSDGVAILGGGLAGLTASYYNGAPVYEAEGAAGGVASSDATDGFVFDRGIHVLQTKNRVILDLLAELGVELANYSRKAFIYSHNCYTAYPFQVNTAGLPIGLRARCTWDFLRRNQHPEPTNYEDWIYRSIGTGFAETFLIPYSEKFWTIHPREMTWDWTGGRVPKPTVAQVLRGAIWNKQTRIGTNVDFRYPQGGAGYGAIAKALLRRTGPMHLGYRASHLDTTNRQVSFSNGESIRYDLLISTIPLPELIRICPDAPEEVKAACAKLRTNSIRVVNLGIDRANLSDRHWVHFPEKDIRFFRISYPSNFGSGLAPKGTSSISAEVAYSPSQPLDDTLVDRVVDDLIRVGVLRKNDRVILKTTKDIKYAYCIYDTHRIESVRTIYNWLKSVGVMPCGRYGLWTYFWSDESMLSGKKAAETAARILSGSSVAPEVA